MNLDQICSWTICAQGTRTQSNTQFQFRGSLLGWEKPAGSRVSPSFLWQPIPWEGGTRWLPSRSRSLGQCLLGTRARTSRLKSDTSSSGCKGLIFIREMTNKGGQVDKDFRVLRNITENFFLFTHHRLRQWCPGGRRGSD